MKKIIVMLLVISFVFVSCSGKEVEKKEEKKEEFKEEAKEEPKEKKEELTWDEDYTVKKEGGVISASLMMPKADKVPVVLIIGGSGPIPKNGFANEYIMMADLLKKEGIATISYDKIGVGKSLVENLKESDVTIDTFVKDATLLVDKIKDDSRFSKVYIAGHSQGSLIAALVAKEKDIDGIISIAGVGRGLGEVLMEQLKRNPNNTEKILAEGQAIIDELAKGKKVEKIPSYYGALFRDDVQNLMISWIKLDPSKEYASLDIPVLIIQGAKDIQVSVEDAKILDNVSKNSTLVILDNMSHVLKDTDDENDMTVYKDKKIPINTKIIKEIVKFVK